MIVKIDKRETARVCEASKYYMARYKIIIEELEIGDFIFASNGKEVVFEYKTMSDFMWSLSEGRLFDQAIRQSKNFKHHYIIIEWNEKSKKKTNKHLKHVKKELTSDALYESIAQLNSITQVLICPTKDLSFPLMEKHAKICFENDPLKKTPKSKSDNVAYNFLMLIEGVNKVKAHTICKQLKLKTIADLTGLTTKKLLKVPGIGPVTAQRIITSIK